MWKLMLQKEQSRYIQRNKNIESPYGEKVVVDKCLKVFNSGGNGNEIFINGNGTHQKSEQQQQNGQQRSPQESNAFPQKLSTRSYSVPRRLNDKHYSTSQMNINHQQISSSSTEINLDVSLLPIFHKILSEQQRQQGQQQRLSLRERERHKRNKKFMVSCPNILIKCDIVEYL